MTFEAESEQRYERLRRDRSRAVARACPGWQADRREDLVQLSVIRVMEIERKSEGRGSPGWLAIVGDCVRPGADLC